jgi:hypothetical protein
VTGVGTGGKLVTSTVAEADESSRRRWALGGGDRTPAGDADPLAC